MVTVCHTRLEHAGEVPGLLWLQKGVRVKKALSISGGSSKRDHKVVVTLLGQQVEIERRGTDGDYKEAARLFLEYDGKVDALGAGGLELGMQVFDRYYPMHSGMRVIKDVKKTPVTNGDGLKYILERRVMPYIQERIGDEIQPRRALICSAVDRFGMTMSFFDAGYAPEDVVFGDLMFALGLPIPVRGLKALERLARILLPVVSHLPMSVLYPTGEQQELHTPKFEKWYNWATVIAGDCIFIKHYSPHRMDGKTVVTNTTTARDIEIFRERGVRYLVTTTPRFEGGRTFGTNATEAALIAVSGKNRRLTHDELEDMLDELGFVPTILKLND